MNNQLNIEEKLYYIYRHTRADKNEPFYIGKGTVLFDKTTERSMFRRAYSLDGRSLFWRKIAAKSEYEVDILFTSNDIKVIQNKEREFIKFYGRRDLGLGPLCNLTDGGESESGAIRTEEQAKKWAEAMKGKFKKGGDSPHAVPVFAYTIEGNFHKKYDSMTDASIDFGITPRIVSKIVGNNKPSNIEIAGQRRTNGFTFFLEYRGEFFKIAQREKEFKVLKWQELTVMEILSRSSNP